MLKDSLSILVAESDPTVRAGLAVALARLGHAPSVAESGVAAVQTFVQQKFDLALIALRLPDAPGYEVARTIRENERGAWIPIVFLVAAEDEADLADCIQTGCEDYLVKPVSPVLLAAKLRAVLRHQALRRRLVAVSGELLALRRMSNQSPADDALTRLGSRHGFEQRLADEIARARRSREPVSVALIEIDRYGRYAEYFGAQQADECQRLVGAALRSATRRATDFIGRMIDGRFGLVLPNTPAAGALNFSALLIRAVDELKLNHPKSDVLPSVTVSIGTATCVPDDTTHAETLLLRAEDALFAAHEQGRHRAFSFDARTTTPNGVQGLPA